MRKGTLTLTLLQPTLEGSHFGVVSFEFVRSVPILLLFACVGQRLHADD